MTSPFQSIIGTPENAVVRIKSSANECNSYSEEVAEDLRPSALPPKNCPLALANFPLASKRGICAAPGESSEFDRAATAATETAAGRRLQ